MLKILPPIWFFIFLLIALGLHRFVSGTHVFNVADSLVLNVIGIILFVFGMALSLQASKLFKEQNNEILPTSPTNRVLITTGVYKFTRNPMYLGMVAMLLGIGFFVGTLPIFVAALAQFLVLHFVFIPFEEEKLTRLFGEQYITYKNKVRKWL